MNSLLFVGELVLAGCLFLLWLKLDELTREYERLRELAEIAAATGQAVSRIRAERVRAEQTLRHLDRRERGQ